MATPKTAQQASFGVEEDLPKTEQQESFGAEREAAADQAEKPGWWRTALDVVTPSADTASSALQGFAQGASLGFADELAGAAEGYGAHMVRSFRDDLKTPFGRWLLRKAGGPEVSGEVSDALGDLTADEVAWRLFGTKADKSGYDHGVKEARREAHRAQEANPVTYGASRIAGAVTTPGPRGVSAARTGAAQGAAAGLGESESETLGGTALDTLGGATFGAAFGKAVDKSFGSPAFRRWFAEKAQNAALRAVGHRAGIDNQLKRLGYEDVQEARALGQHALDEQLVKGWRTAEDVLTRTREKMGAEGDRIGALLDQLDDVARAKSPDAPFNADEAAWEAVANVLGPQGLTPTAQRAAKGRGGAATFVDDILRLPESGPGSSFNSARQLKTDIGKAINWRADPELNVGMAQRAYKGLGKSMENQADRVIPGAGDALRTANTSYAKLKDIESLALDEAQRQSGRTPWWSPKTLTAAFAGAQRGDTGLSSGAGFASPFVAGFLGPRSNSAVATAMDRVAKDPSRAWGKEAREAARSSTRALESSDPWVELKKRLGLE